MPMYTIMTTADTQVSERWKVEAADEEEAKEKLHAGEAEFIEETNIGDEENRTVVSVEVEADE